MKSRKATLIAAMTLFAALASIVRLAAQDDAAQAKKPKHHHYKLIDLGTLGGPSSYFNAFVDGFSPGINDVFFSGAQLLNKCGTLAGWADTSTPDPFPGFCFNSDCFVSHAFQWQEGTVTDLGALASGWSSAATWINDSGQIVGLSENGAIDPLIGFPEVRAVLWKNGQIFDLGTKGGNQSAALSMNNHGQIAGLALNTILDPFSIYDLLLYGSSNGTQTRAVLWDMDGRMQDLGTLGTGNDASAFFVNEAGQVAGFAYTNSIPNPTTDLPTFHPFLWERGKGMQDLGTLGGTVAQAVNSLNERGQVAGSTTLAGDATHHPFLWDGKKLIDLGTLGGDNGEADWLNDGGEVVGIAQYTVSCPNGLGGAHAFLWRNGVMTDLGTTDGIANSEAVFINSRTQVVGYSFSCDFSVTEAFLWEKGSSVNLNALISFHSAFHLFFPAFINDQGEIGVFGSLSNGDQHALLLIPCDENHPGVEGCDYSMVEGTATTGVSSAPTMLTPTSANQIPGLRGAANPMLRRFGRRLMPSYRGLGAQPPK